MSLLRSTRILHLRARCAAATSFSASAMHASARTRSRARGSPAASTAPCAAASARRARARTAHRSRARDRAVALGHDPRGGALEDVQLRRPSARSAGTNWIALAPVPITATRLPVQVVVVVPARRVKRRALERREARDVGQRRDVERAVAEQQRARLEVLAARGRDAARCRSRVEARLGDLPARISGAGAGRTCPRSARGTRGSRPARRTRATTAGSARTRTSTGARARRRRRRDTCSRARCRRRGRPSRGSRSR